MKDYQLHLEKLRRDAAECAVVRDPGSPYSRSTDDMAAPADQVSPKRVRRYFGDCKLREDSRWFMKDAVSACRTRLKRSSRAMLPGASLSAASLNFRASSAKRSSKVAVCLTRLRR
jgi:hypothetical protein